jgi:NADH-quinone oxidoreductase subunit N
MIDSESLLRQLWAVNHANVLLLGGVFFISLGLMRAVSSLRMERLIGGVGCLAVLAIAAITMLLTQPTEANAGALFISDSITLSGTKLTIFGGALLVLLGWDQIRPGHAADHYGCLLMMLSGLIYASSANDLVSLFLGLELVSIPTTVLLSINRNDDLGREATLKYFTLASFSSAIFLLGASYLYGLAGSTALPEIYDSLAGDTSVFARVALGLSLCGLCFRVTAVPFHFYAPDVFAGSAPHLAASMSLAPKVAGFVAIVRLLGGAELNPAMADIALPLLLVIAVTTMTLGNCAALVQTRLRRTLAYSSIAHSGYLLLAVAAVLSTGGAPTIIFDYLVIYAAMTLGLFAVVLCVEKSFSGSDELSHFNGLYFRNPWLALGGTICLLSLTGLPLTAGFWAKLQIFLTSLAADRLDIRVAAIVMAINATIAAVYYLSLCYRLYQPNTETQALSRVPFTISAACGVSSVLTVVWFFIP